MTEPLTGPVLAFSRESRFQFEPFDSIEPLRQSQMVKGVLPAQGVAFIVGSTKAGKTFFAVDTCCRIAAGAKVLGRRTRQGGVVYIAAEDPHGCRARVTAWRKRYGRQSYMPFELVGQAVNLLSEDDRDDIKASLRDAAGRFEENDHRLSVIVFDTLSRCIPGVDENSSEGMSRAFAALADIATATEALVIVVAHFGKSGAEKGIRGWSGLDANSDATVTVEREESEPDLRLITLAKVKNGVDGARHSFRLESVPLGIVDEDGEEITSCVPVYEAAPERVTRPRKRKVLTPAEVTVLTAVKFVTEHGETFDPPSVPGLKGHHRAVRKADVQERARKAGLAGEGEKNNTVNQRFYRSLEAIGAAGHVRIEGDVLWLI